MMKKHNEQRKRNELNKQSYAKYPIVSSFINIKKILFPATFGGLFGPWLLWPRQLWNQEIRVTVGRSTFSLIVLINKFLCVISLDVDTPQQTIAFRERIVAILQSIAYNPHPHFLISPTTTPILHIAPLADHIPTVQYKQIQDNN